MSKKRAPAAPIRNIVFRGGPWDGKRLKTRSTGSTFTFVVGDWHGTYDLYTGHWIDKGDLLRDLA